MLKSLFLVFVFMIGMVSSAHAVETTQLLKWLDGEKGRDCRAAALYLKGMHATLASVNTILGVRKQKKLFCRPTMTSVQMENILRRYARKGGDDYPGKSDAAVALVFALQRAFPCKN